MDSFKDGYRASGRAVFSLLLLGALMVVLGQPLCVEAQQDPVLELAEDGELEQEPDWLGYMVWVRYYQLMEEQAEGEQEEEGSSGGGTGGGGSVDE
jgi:hypothetical protein